jgi:TolB-like protein/Tfp pilus assembly protein PilF
MVGHRFTFGSFVLDTETGTLLKAGEPVPVGYRAFRLLTAFVERPNEVLTKRSLMDATWEGTVVEEANLSVQVAILRKHLGSSTSGAEWIATIPRVGYRFAGDVERGDTITPHIASTELQRNAAEDGRFATRPPAGSGPPSVAVLPFNNLSSDPEQDYFADGIVDDIITALSRFRSLSVVARNSSFTYKGRAVDVRDVARDLGAGYVLEGSIRKSGGKLRVNAQLVSGSSGDHVWAHTFDGPLEEIFDVQDRITAGVAALVAPSIEKAELQRARLERPGSLAVYDLYLRALARFEARTPQDNAAGLELLDRVIALDPDYAPALALAAHSRAHRITMGWPAYRNDDRETALDLARRALDRAGDDGTAIARCGMVMLFVGRDFDRGVSLLDRAVAINPNSEVAVTNAGLAHVMGGSLDKATEYCLRAIDMSLHQTIAMTGLADISIYSGRYEEAIEWATRSMASNPNFNGTYWALISANALLGRSAEAARWLALLREMSPNVTLSSISRGVDTKDPRRAEAYKQGLRLAGMPES